MINPALLGQLLIAMSMLLTNALNSGDPAQMQSALTTAQQTIAIIGETKMGASIVPTPAPITPEDIQAEQLPPVPITEQLQTPVMTSAPTSTPAPYTGGYMCYNPKTPDRYFSSNNPSGCSPFQALTQGQYNALMGL